MVPDPIRTARLDLQVLVPDVAEALLAGDAARLQALTGARFPEPVAPPPLMEDVLPMLRDKLRAHPAELGWWAWLVVDRAAARVVGSVGLGGPPDAEGGVIMGYATYPGHEGRGFATEAAAALRDWAFAHGARRVAATIPPDNEGSRRVAERIGMRRVGGVWEEEIGDVDLYAVESA